MLIFDEKGLQRVPDSGLDARYQAGTYVQLFDRDWMLRVKRRTSGHTWKRVSRDDLPKRLKLEALIKGIQL